MKNKNILTYLGLQKISRSKSRFCHADRQNIEPPLTMVLSQDLDSKLSATYVGIEHQSGLESIQLQVKRSKENRCLSLRKDT